MGDILFSFVYRWMLLWPPGHRETSFMLFYWWLIYYFSMLLEKKLHINGKCLMWVGKMDQWENWELRIYNFNLTNTCNSLLFIIFGHDDHVTIQEGGGCIFNGSCRVASSAGRFTGGCHLKMGGILLFLIWVEFTHCCGMVLPTREVIFNDNINNSS